jgi:hypothetical protein
MREDQAVTGTQGFGRQINFIQSLRGNAFISYMKQVSWHAMENDLIGGWCVMPLPLPPSSGVPTIADFTAEQHARYIADLHNARLKEGRNDARVL